MSDAVAHPNCAAHFCPCLGVMTRSTTGTTDWYCSIHFRHQSAQWGRISEELNRLKWLVDIVRAARATREKDWHVMYEAAKKQMLLNMSGHLCIGRDETGAQWLARMEATLDAACNERQQDLQPPGE